MGSVGLAGCLGTVDSLLDSDGGRPGYLGWLPPPGTLVPADRYRFGSVRPPRLTDRDRVGALLPTVAGTGLDPWEATRIVAGNGGYGVTMAFDHQTVIETLRDDGYDYVDGVGEAWIMARDGGDPPVYAVGVDHIAVGYPTTTADAHTVAHTLIRAPNTTPHWTAAPTPLTTLVETLGDPPVITVGRHDQVRTTAPNRAAFPGAIGWAVAEHGTAADGATVAILYPDATDPATDPVRTWAETMFTDPTLATTESTIVIDIPRPQRPWTLLPVPDRAWPMTGADPAHTAARRDTRPVTQPVGVDWTYSATVNGAVTPIVTDIDHAYLGVGDLLALDRTDGTRRWRVDTTVTGPPAVADDTVVAPVTDGVIAVDATDGTTTWFHPLPDHTLTAPVIADGTVYIGLTPPDPGGVLALSLSNGDPTWSGLDTPVDAVPAVADATVYTIADDPNRQDQHRLHALDTSDGTPHWQTDVPGSTQYPLGVDATHVYATTPANLTAVNRDTATTDWSIAPAESPLSGPPAIHADRIILTHSRPGTSRPGSLVVRDAQTGDARLTRQLDHAVVGQPTVAGDTIALAGPAGSLAVYDSRTGVRHWQTPVAGHLHPATAVDDHLLVTTTAGRITSLSTNWLPSPTAPRID